MLQKNNCFPIILIINKPLVMHYLFIFWTAVLPDNTLLMFLCYFFQVNGLDTVRVPISLFPYEDPSASSQRQLKAQKRQQAAAADSEAADEEGAVLKAVSDAAAEAEAGEEPAGSTAAATQTTADTTAPPSGSLKKD